MSGAKILLLDIETAPNLAFVYGLFNENIPIQRIVDAGYTMCWAGKWYDSKEIMFSSLNTDTPRQMLKKIHKLLCEADIVIHYYGKRFDIPTLNKEFIKLGLKPPSPYKQIDLCATAKSEFKFASNKLEYVAKFLGLKPKVKHKGFELWKECMDGNSESWKEMEEYNKGDIWTLQEVYDTMKPWIRNHPNLGLYVSDESPVCRNCGESHLQKRGFARTEAGVYQRYQCQPCGAWVRGKTLLKRTKTQ